MKEKMKIVIAGCGRVGAELAQQLSQEGHSVTVVDADAKRLSDVSGLYDVLGVEGNCATKRVLEEAGAGEADLMIAATGSDEQNLLACLLAKNLHAKHTIARVSDPDYADEMDLLTRDLGLSMYVNPDYAAATEIFRMLRFPSAENIEVFAGGRVEIVELLVPPDSAAAGKTLREVNELSGAHILVCSVMRDGQAYIPKGDFQLRAGDRIGVTGEPGKVNRAFRKLGFPLNRTEKVMLVGGGNMSYYLAKMLEGIGAQTSIVERDEARCRELLELLSGRTEIFMGDGSDHELLGEVGIGGMDGFCALTGSDEENIVLGMYADSLDSVGRVIVRTSSGNLARLAQKAGLSSTFSPKHITADLISQYVRGMSNSQDSGAEMLHPLCGDRAAALEFSVDGVVDRITGVPLKELKLRKDLLIACIIRGKEVIIPDGNSQISRGDHVLVVTTAQDIREIQNILA